MVDILIIVPWSVFVGADNSRGRRGGRIGPSILLAIGTRRLSKVAILAAMIVATLVATSVCSQLSRAKASPLKKKCNQSSRT